MCDTNKKIIFKVSIMDNGINKKLLMSLLFSMTLLCVSGTDIYIASLPQMVHDFNTTSTMINLTIMTCSVGMSISVLIAGILSNRFGRKVILVYGVLIFSISAFLIVWVSSIWMILFLRALQGMGIGSIMIVQRLVLRDTMTESEQVHAGGILVLGSILSPAIAPVIGALLASLWSWRLCFLVSSILGLIITILSLMLIKETNTTPIKKLPRLGAYLKDYIVLLRDPVCLNLTIIMCLTFAVHFAFLGVSSYLYILVLGLSPLAYSYIFIFLSISYFLGNSYMMYLNKHGFTTSQIMKRGVLGGVGGVIVLFISLLVHSTLFILISLTIGVMITRIASALIINPTHIKIINHYKERGALALGIAVCMQSGVAGTVAAVVGKFSQSQLLYGFVVMSGSFLIIALLSFIALQRFENREIRVK